MRVLSEVMKRNLRENRRTQLRWWLFYMGVNERIGIGGFWLDFLCFKGIILHLAFWNVSAQENLRVLRREFFKFETFYVFLFASQINEFQSIKFRTITMLYRGTNFFIGIMNFSYPISTHNLTPHKNFVNGSSINDSVKHLLRNFHTPPFDLLIHDVLHWNTLCINSHWFLPLFSGFLQFFPLDIF